MWESIETKSEKKINQSVWVCAAIFSLFWDVFIRQTKVFLWLFVYMVSTSRKNYKTLSKTKTNLITSNNNTRTKERSSKISVNRSSPRHIFFFKYWLFSVWRTFHTKFEQISSSPKQKIIKKYTFSLHIFLITLNFLPFLLRKRYLILVFCLNCDFT